MLFASHFGSSWKLWNRNICSINWWSKVSFNVYSLVPYKQSYHIPLYWVRYDNLSFQIHLCQDRTSWKPRKYFEWITYHEGHHCIWSSDDFVALGLGWFSTPMSNPRFVQLCEQPNEAYIPYIKGSRNPIFRILLRY